MIFEVKQGSFSYMDENKKNTLGGIEYCIKEGELMAVLGRNGAGKTTMLRCSMGMLPWKNGGSYLDGTNIKKIRRQELWKRMGYVPQAKKGYGQFKVKELVLLGRSSYLKPWQQPGEVDLDCAEHALLQVGMLEFKDRTCNKLSGGELQMVLIAKALAGNPQLLILDEPESNLDFKNQLLILKTLQRLAKENGISCIFNTHYPGHALQYADKVLLLDSNGSSIFGETDELVTKENLERLFGVRVEIQELETGGRIYREVLPLEIIK